MALLPRPGRRARPADVAPMHALLFSLPDADGVGAKPSPTADAAAPAETTAACLAATQQLLAGAQHHICAFLRQQAAGCQGQAPHLQRLTGAASRSEDGEACSAGAAAPATDAAARQPAVKRQRLA